MPALLLAATAVVAAGCAHTGAGKLNTGTHDFSISGAGFETTARVTTSGLQGPQIDVGRYDNGNTFRGTAFHRPVDLTVSNGSVKGLWGRIPFTLDVSDPTPQGFKVNGLIAGVPSAFSVSPDRIEGTIGHCAYDLGRSGNTYLGSRSCRGAIDQVTLRVPESMAEWSDADVAVALSLLLPAV